MKKHILFIFLFLNFFTAQVFADASFVVKKIRVDGLQRISSQTVESYLPLHTGETLRGGKTAAIIKALYQTGFFEHITVGREGNTLVIKVIERPTIGQLKISGNSAIPTDKLKAVMKSVSIAEGLTYNSVMLDRIKQSLISEYYQLGRYNAQVTADVTPMPRNRVLVKIIISEGLIAKVTRINIIGNHAFSEKVLDKQLKLTTPGLLTFFTKTDLFSQQKLADSLDALAHFYQDHGYLKFTVKSSQTSITPDHKSMYVTIVIDEGAQYTVKGFRLQGNTVLPTAELVSKVKIQPGAIFSRQAVVDAEKAVSDKLGEHGYVFALVSLQPTIDDQTKTVFLTFNISAGKRAYVRNIYFSDNTRTNDAVLRREVQQMEGAVVSTAKLDQSKHQLSLLPYIRDVQMDIAKVPTADDQVDVNYKVTEESSTQATFGLSYSQLYHFGLNAGLNQKNFLGTGKTVGLNFSGDRYQKYYGVSYSDPYFTQNGVRRSINLALSKFNPHGANISRSYSTNQYSLSDVYDIPIEIGAANTRIQLGYGYEDTQVKLGNEVSNVVQDYVNRHGRHFQQLDLIGGISRDSRDRAIFPTSGVLQSLSFNFYAPLNKRSLKYYTMAYDMHWYQPLVGKFVATARGALAYGNALNGGPRDFPFFKNFYAGGIDSVRGYEGNTLGPRDSNGDPVGGNLLGDAGVGIVFPNFISDNLRTTLFMDGGNVYETYNNRPLGGTASGNLRYSTGIEGDWLTPLGLIDVSIAKALNPKRGDSREFFQFSLGANFG